MKVPKIAIKLKANDYAGHVNLGNRVMASMTGNGNFTTPVPTLIALGAAITDVEDAIALWGPEGNRGSHAQLDDLRQKTLALYLMLKAMAAYVTNTAALTAGADYSTMQAIMTSSGFELANVGSPQGVLEMVQNFHRFVSRQLNVNQVKLKWEKPLNLKSDGNVKAYKVFRSSTPQFSTAELVKTTTATSFIDTNTGNSVVTWNYWVLAINNAGAGVLSDMITLSVLGVA